jgi:ADP-heptose:LPS heptosyltransferase
MKKKLLLNYVYWSPVGHAIEALKYAKGFYDANKDVEIYIIFNKDTTTELAKLCPWIKKVYLIDLSSIKKSIDKIPKKWDYIVIDKRARTNNNYFKQLIMYQNEFNIEIKANIWKGYTDFWKMNEKSPLKYNPNSKIMITSPKKNKDFIKKRVLAEKNICIVLGGSSSAGKYPSIESWIKIIKNLKIEFPKYQIILTGVLKNKSKRTTTRAYGAKEIERLKKEVSGIKDMYNIGFMNQIALLEKCDLFISPHTGFAFLAPCVNTPWLAISGTDWPEYFFNDSPFYSAIKFLKHYPGYTFSNQPSSKDVTKRREYFGLDDETMIKRIPDIVKGAKLLIDKKIDYKSSVKIHIRNLKNSNFKISSFFSFDDVIKLRGIKKW